MIGPPVRPARPIPMPNDLFPSPDTTAAFLAALVEHTDDGVVSTDLSGKVRTWNTGAERIFGYTADEMIGRSLSVLMPGGTGAFTPVLDRLRAGERLDRIEAVRIAKDRRLVHVSLMGTAVRDAQGQVVGALAVIRDISAQKRADLQREATEARWRAIIDSAVDGIIVIDARGRIEAFNRAAERMFGYTEAEVLGQNVNMLMPSPYRDEHDGYIEALPDAPASSGSSASAARSPACARTARRFRCTCRSARWQVGGERHFTGILHDLTPRIAARGAAARADRAGPPRRDGGRDRARSQEPAGGRPRRHPGDRRPAAGRQQGRADRQGDHRAPRRAERSDPGPAAVRAAAAAASSARSTLRRAARR